ncbi:MAG: DUF2490 domain-containing protein [Gemmatimonadetes bacterium]|nr:DUF2490 domain-containing protein [Gemmatimonadota bacterium]
MSRRALRAPSTKALRSLPLPLPRLAVARLAVALLAVALPAASPPLAAQPTRADPVDWQAWYGGALTVDLPRRWETQVDYRVRYQDNASRWLGSYVTTELSRGVGRGLRLGGSYRLAQVGDRTFHRLAAGPSWERRVAGVRVGARVLAQYQRQTFDGDDEGGSDTDTFVRTRLQLRRPLTRWLRGYVSTEPFFAVGGDFPADNWRNTIGTEWDLGKGRALDLFYIYRPDYGKRSYNRTFHVVGVQLELDWKP